ncbi:H-NS histone family protein [Burkholderia sp. BCC0405]|uniref:H-NS histone family protein n=1 Tax=Burkholderia sp. BCC0405 TaxID=2676298 RepID=UPI00158F4F95|nr:H-NS histone family protein [Burkholderia sp. BCC0405]
MKKYGMLLAEYAMLSREIDLAREHEIKLIVERVVAVLEASGISHDDLLKSRRSKPTSNGRIAPKYWNKSTGETWSGRGREPRWIIGRDRREFSIPIHEESKSGHVPGGLKSE